MPELPLVANRRRGADEVAWCSWVHSLGTRRFAAVSSGLATIPAVTTATALTLFGIPTLRVGDEALILGTERPFQLLAYLGCRAGWVSRDELAEWLWPGRGPSAARSNLRKTLLLARKIASDPALEQSGERVRWLPGSDLQAFESACDEGRVDAAIALASEPLLLGMDNALSPVAAEWLALERARVEARLRRACEHGLEALRERPRECRALAETMLSRDPFDESAVRALASALIRLDQKDAASQVLEAHAKRLMLELGLEPSSSLRKFVDEVRQGSPTPAAGGSVRRPPEPPPGHFVGRRAEGAQIASLLAQPSCRLLTLMGPPGIGKSALARNVLPSLATGFADGSAFVTLEDVTAVSQAAGRLASTLGLESGDDGPAWQAIGQAIGARALLLVLDNAEHLPLTQPIEQLIGMCPRVKLLVTSRERLGVVDEWLLPLEGLPLPDHDETDAEVLRHCDSVRLFEARALQRAPDFELARAAAAVVRLLHLVEGLPLAIELSAAWARVMPVADIAEELSVSIDLLEPSSVGQRGVRASFDQSWLRLTPIEQAVLSRLAHLPGWFGRDMARQVAGASLPVIAALVDKSLLRSEHDGRFSMHALVRQCAAVHADDADDVLARHARATERWAARFRDMAQMPLAEIETEVPHLRAAFQWATEQRDASMIVSLSPVLDRFCQQRGLWKDGTALFSAAVAAFDGERAGAERPLLSVLRPLASLRFCSGDLVEAEALSRRSLRIAQRLRDAESTKSALNAVGISLCQQGNYAQARPFFEQAVRQARRDDDERNLANVSGNLAICDEAVGRYESALDHYRLSARLHREAGRAGGLATNLNNLANLLRILQRSREMLAPLHEALELCQAHGLDATLPFVLVTLGLAHDDLGEADEARRWFERALDAARSHGEPNIEASALLGQSRLQAAGGDFPCAWKTVGAALAIAEQLRSLRLQLDCVLGFGEVLAREGRLEAAAALVQWCLTQPAMMQADVEAARRRLIKLIPEDLLASAHTSLASSATVHEALAAAALAGPSRGGSASRPAPAAGVVKQP